MARTSISAIARFAPCTINVRGKVLYSRVATRVEGDELAAKNQQAASKGFLPHTKPYISITIQNPVVVDNGTVPAEVKAVIQERFYVGKDGVPVYTQESKSPFMPIVAYSNDAGPGLAGQGIADDNIHLPAELAKGLDVTIGVSLYSKNNFSGLGINYILVNEPVKYYSNSSISNDFEAMGITYVAPTAQSALTPENTVEAQPVMESVPPFAVQQPVQQTYVQQPAPNYGATQASYQPVPNQTIYATSEAPAQAGAQPETNFQRPVRYY